MQNPKSNPQTLTRWILESQRKNAPTASGDLSILLTSIQLSCKFISHMCNKAGIFNLYGTTGKLNESLDNVKKLDILSNETMINSLTFTGKVAVMASEENQHIIRVEGNLRGRYVLVFDPLDGSSNIDANISIGTIFGIYDIQNPDAEPTEADLLRKGRELIAAGYCMYGSASIMVVSVGHGVEGFTLDNTMGEFILTHPDIRIPKDSKQIYSVNEGNSSNWDKAVARLKKKNGEGDWSHRYVGSMVSDVHRTLLYGGIFMYPADKRNTNGKLRLVYEGNPMAYLIEQAGGKASTGRENILDIKPNSIHQRIPILLGTDWMVERVESYYSEMGCDRA